MGGQTDCIFFIMAAPIPASLKQFTSILRRAEELERDAENKESQVCWVKLFCTIQPTVLFFQVLAYFCRLYIVTKDCIRQFT